MNLFSANKQLMFNVTLGELKAMTPQEGWVFSKQIEKAVKELEVEKAKNGI